MKLKKGNLGKSYLIYGLGKSGISLDHLVTEEGLQFNILATSFLLI